MEYKASRTRITPRLIIDGGAGNILPSNLPPAKHKLYHDSLIRAVSTTYHFLTSPSVFTLSSDTSASISTPCTSAIDAATLAVSLLEDNPLFNSGHGAVFTRAGTNELEASLMVSRGKKKRGVGVMGLQHVKNPIKLAREMLIRGEEDLEGGNGEHRGPMTDILGNSSGAQGHCQLYRDSAERLAKQWGLELVDEKYFFVQARWDEHIRGLDKEEKGKGLATWDAAEYLPQGTCGAVALDADGVLAVATSTGGMTNKLPGRIGDTPTLGAGFWAEEWEEEYCSRMKRTLTHQAPLLEIGDTLKGILADCLPSLSSYQPLPPEDLNEKDDAEKIVRSTALSGTGNGDSFLRMNAARTASAIARYRGSCSPHGTLLSEAVREITGPDGELQKSAGKRWKKTGEGEGGIIGIELSIVEDGQGRLKKAQSHIVQDYNCGGMFRAWIKDDGKAVMRVWRPGQYPSLYAYDCEGKEFDTRNYV